MNITTKAMLFAMEKHRLQRRKYTNAPYVTHLAEVAGIVASVAMSRGLPNGGVQPEDAVATAWLHDSMEDQGVTRDELLDEFGPIIGYGVVMLSDMETGNRAERKAASRKRLSGAPAWIQTIKLADLISNTSNIVEHDPDFAHIYLREKEDLLSGLSVGDADLFRIASRMVLEGKVKLGMS